MAFQFNLYKSGYYKRYFEPNQTNGFIANIANSQIPAVQYQRQRIIQNTVRTAASTYLDVLQAVTVYQKPLNEPQFISNPSTTSTPYYVPKNVRWNQMSDRATPSIQKANPLSNTTCYTRNTPGSLSPGGQGCDVKHGGYFRYLNQLKAKHVKRGTIPPNFGEPIPFNPAFPIYGNKTVKTGIVSKCDCADDSLQTDYKHLMNKQNPQNIINFNLPLITYSVGDYVLVKINPTMSSFIDIGKYTTEETRYKGKIISITNSNNIHQYEIMMVDENDNAINLGETLTYYYNELHPYIKKTECCTEPVSLVDKYLAMKLNNSQTNDTTLTYLCELEGVV